MKPTPAEAESELLLTLAKAFRNYVTDPTPRADDHLYLETLDRAIERVEKARAPEPGRWRWVKGETPKPIPGGRPDSGMLFPDGTS